MKLLALVLGATLVGAVGVSGNAVAHGGNWRAYDWDDHRGRVTQRHQHQHGRRHGHHRRQHHWQRPPRWSRKHRHHRHDRYDHDDVWYGLHLFLGGH